MNCDSCNATMVQVRGQNHSHCAACNGFHFPNDAASAEDSIVATGKVTEFQCPKCRQALQVGKLRNMLDVCFCQNCRGFVIDNESLGQIIPELRGSYQGQDDQPVPVDPKDLEQRTDCPACQELMDSHPYYGPGNVVIDTCMNCRLAWMDHGELARIVRAPGVRPDSEKIGNYESAAIRQALYDQAETRKGQALAMFFSNM